MPAEDLIYASLERLAEQHDDVTALLIAANGTKREGMKILIADQDEARIEETLTELQGMGGEADGMVVDVRNYSECENMGKKAMADWGRIDVLVASAGVSEHRFFLDSKPEDWDALIDINVRGVLNTVRAIAPHMAERKKGSIITLASEAAKTGEKRIVVYGATKGAVASFAKGFALEMGRFNVRVNAVCPAVTITPMVTGGFELPQDVRPEDTEFYKASSKFYPLGRLGQPADIASMITFLASDEASWITGQAISVNGGFGRS